MTDIKPVEVVSVALSDAHEFSKQLLNEITLLTGLGVEGDAHMGVTVKHRSRVAVDPSQPNLRQVHLIQSELFEELTAKGFSVVAGDMGENITTLGVDLLALPRDTLLYIGLETIIKITGLRNPCGQIDNFKKGLLKAVLGRDQNGELVRKAGIMAVVIKGGKIKPHDGIKVELPPEPHHKLERV